MTAPFYISNRVIDTIQSLPEDDRIALSTAIVGEMLLGAGPAPELTPIQALAYQIIRRYVKQDTRKVVG